MRRHVKSREPISRSDGPAPYAGSLPTDRRGAGTLTVDTQYEQLLRRVLETGEDKSDRTGTGTLSLFGERLRYDLSAGFPMVTTKSVHFRSLAYELLWFLRGDSNVRWLQDKGVTIWDAWASPEGELGPVYGVQWRSWPTPGGGHVDQLSQLMDTLEKDPHSRRMVISAWNVSDIPDMALAPCHALFQFHVAGGKLSCQLYQRSADLFLGVPFNIASYALLTHMVAQQAGLEVGDLIWVGGDCHIYSNHLEQVREQLTRDAFPFPTLELAKAPSLFDYAFEDMVLVDYQHHPAIKGAVAV
jgi:thymidylate synthase